MFRNIQALRGYAATLVLFHHAAAHYQAMNGHFSLFNTVSEWGFIGVDIFFVISGFVIAHTTLSKERTFDNGMEFLKHRLARIYLGYWPFFIMACFVILKYDPNRWHNLLIFDSAFLINADVYKMPLSIAWTLCYELYFYGIFTLLFFISSKWVTRMIPILFLLVLARAIYVAINPFIPWSFWLSPFLAEFFAGTLLYIFHEKFNNHWFILIGILLAIISFKFGVYIDATDHYKATATNSPYRVFTFGTTALAVVSIWLVLEKTGIYNAQKLFVALGESSYTLYLSHFIFLDLFYFTGIRDFFTHYYSWSAEIGFVLFLIFCWIFSHWYYLKIERPIYRSVCKTDFGKYIGFILKKF